MNLTQQGRRDNDLFNLKINFYVVLIKILNNNSEAPMILNRFMPFVMLIIKAFALKLADSAFFDFSL